MNWFNNLKLKSKLITAFSLLLGLMIVIGFFALYQLSNTNSITQEITTNWMPSSTEAAEMNNAVADFRAAELQHVLSGSQENRARYEKQMDDALARYKKAETAYIPLISSPEEKTFYEQAKNEWNAFMVVNEKLIQLSRQNKMAEASELIRGESQKHYDAASDSLDKLIEMNVKGGDDASKRSNSLFSTARLLIIGAIMGCTLLGVFAMIFLANLLTKPIGEVIARLEQLQSLCVTNLNRGTHAMQQGDLTVEIVTGTPFFDVTSQDEIGKLKACINKMIQDLRAAIAAFETTRKTVLHLVDETRTVADEVGAGNLNARCDANSVQGSYRDLSIAVNNLVQNIATPLTEVGSVLNELSAQNLTAQVKGDYKGEYEKLKIALNHTASTLNQTLSQVALSAEQVNSAAGEISSGSQTLAQGSSEQASSLEEVSSSLQEMRAMIQQNASNAKEGRSLSEATRQTTDRGVTSMHNLTDAIDRIKASSDATAKIVKTIDEIAFQTNLLALNAAVEAARAGDAGKGFAVVADEVRALAMRSAEAARQTADLIEESVKNSDSGVALNREALSNLEEINQQVEKVSVVMTEIATSSQQQSQSVEQINAAVEQMNLVTQQAAANSEESAAAAEELSGQAEELSLLVGQFQLSAQMASPSASSRTRAVPTFASPKPVTKPAPKKLTARAGAGKASANFSSTSTAESVIPFDDDSSTDTLQEF